jgi:hypothetical protein
MKTSVLIILTLSAHSRGSRGHEQRPQERAARLVRSDVHAAVAVAPSERANTRCKGSVRIRGDEPQ